MDREQQYRKFAHHYYAHSNARKAALEAGFTEREAKNAQYILKTAIVQDELGKFALRSQCDAIMTRIERMETLTRIARGEVEGARVGDRIKSIELLGKMEGDYLDRVEHSGEQVLRVVWDD